MVTQAESRTQRYYEQTKASQYDPDVDITLHAYQQQSQQQGQLPLQQQTLNSRSSEELTRPITDRRIHYPDSSTSSSLTATTVANPSFSALNNVPTSLPASLYGVVHDKTIFLSPPSALVPSSPLTRSTDSIPNASSSLSQPSTSGSQHSAPLLSKISSPILETAMLSQFAPSISKNPSSPRQSIDFQQQPQWQQPQQEFHKRRQSRELGTESRRTLDHDKQMAGMSMMSFTTNRQDDGRLQLEQEREFQNMRKFKTWTRSKVLLFLANSILLFYSVACTVVMVMSWKGATWSKPYLDSGIMMIANRNALYMMMVTPPFGIVIALLGYIGIMRQSRKVLSIYAILLWPLFAMFTSIGYICFRRNHVSLYQKLKFSWINEYTRDDRLIIQNALSCCGYRSLGDYPSYDIRCFPRAPLPSCESVFLQYQQDFLSSTSSAAFIILPLQLLVMIVALLCSNHIDNLYRSANPVIPKLYTQ